MRLSIRELPQNPRRGDRKRRVRERRPTVESLEGRALLSTAAVHHPGADEHALAKHARRAAGGYQQINLVSDLPGSSVTDSNLKNPWGMAYSATGPFWISDAGSGVATIYSVTSTNTTTKLGLTVTIPGATNGSTGRPTGQVLNGTSSFKLADGNPATFIFDTLDGTIAAWDFGSGATAETKVTTPGAKYTGLAIGSSGGQDLIYAANTNSSTGIDVFNSSFTKVNLPGNFVDPKLKRGFAKKLTPYNIQAIGGQLYVTYATPYPSFKGGAVAVFNMDGTFVRQIAFNGKAGKLAAPWGVTMAPASFGRFSNDLLVGNFGNGRINAYTSTGKFAGQFTSNGHKPLSIPGLWALGVGNDGRAGSSSMVYFTAGINGQSDGLFGALKSTT